MCCGNKRSELLQKQPVYTKSPFADLTTYQMRSTIPFQYTGQTALTVVGSITRIQYRFGYKGHKQLIDQRDVNAMLALPMLEMLPE